ncbi:MAG: hypothetical protein CR982_03690 [Candidatus Cloacimonadota bacterium]|nr:MAG: hypothetical protein CR982_03690 [Candidatus Cloacimonadota bacterium]PIE79354.1 MAG: hypothetical protein CSA15_03340 [Candidatus Delongbacteria bacterium]
MPDTQITGLSSGIQWKDTVDQLMQIERQPLIKKQKRVKEYEEKKSAWSQISTQLNALKTTLEGMDTLSELSVKKAVSTNSKTLSVRANEKATPGNYSVEILQKANGHKLISEGFSSTSDPIFTSEGTFTIEGYSGEEISFDVNTETNLSELKNKINNNTKSDVTASIMNDGTNYRLILTSKNTGLKSAVTLGGTATMEVDFRDVAISDFKRNKQNIGTASIQSYGKNFQGISNEYTFTVDSVNGGEGEGTIGVDNISLSVRDINGNLIKSIELDSNYVAGTKISITDDIEISFDSGTLAKSSTVSDTYTLETTDPTARDSIIEVENIRVSNESNAVKNVIEGVTLNLNDITEENSPINVTIENDISGVKALISDFAEKYNSVINTVRGYQKWDEELKKGGPLFGDSRATDIITKLNSLLSNINAGIDESQYYKTISQVGVSIKSEGKISIDSKKLDDSLKDNFQEVLKLFGFDYEFTGEGSDKFIYKKRTNNTIGGKYNIDVNIVDGKITSAKIDGVDAKVEGSFITGKKGNGAVGLMIEVDRSVDGNFSSEVRVSTGKNIELINEVYEFTKNGSLDSEKGKIYYINNSIDTSIESLNDQIRSMEYRLEKTRELMEKKWLAMESALTKLKGQSSRVQAMQG